jgi:hypothetical protein
VSDWFSCAPSSAQELLGLAFSVWTLRRLADHMAEQTGIRVEYETVRVHLKAAGIVLIAVPSTPLRARIRSMPSKKGDRRNSRRSRTRRSLLLRRRVQGGAGCPPSRRCGLRRARAGDDRDARPKPKKRYGIGALNYHTGETVVLIRRRKRRREIAELLDALLEKHPTGRV